MKRFFVWNNFWNYLFRIWKEIVSFISLLLPPSPSTFRNNLPLQYPTSYFLEILQKVYKSQMSFEMSNFCTNELNFTYFLKFSYRFLLFYKMKMDLERIGGRHRDNSHHFAAESEALDQIAKEVRFINNVYYYPDCQQSMESSMVF